jgi:hypothetical protein
MFMLDRWEELAVSGKYDADTLQAAKSLAFEMCADIFDRMGLSATTDDDSLRVSGRGTTIIFPLRGDNVPLKYSGREGTSRLGIRHGSSVRESRRGQSFKGEGV